jgi:hypothetical protein
MILIARREMLSAFLVPLGPATKVTKEQTPGAMKNFTTL